MAVVRVTITMQMLGQSFQNVIHFAHVDGALTTDGVRAEVQTYLTTRLRNHQNVNLTYSTLSVQPLLPVLQPADVFSMAGAHGSLDGLPYHPSIAVLFSIRTAHAGRNGHGRWYMPGVHYDFVENGVLRPDIYALYQGDATYMTNAFKTGGVRPLTMVVCSRSNPADYKSMTQIVARQVLGIQRRRNIGVGG